MLSLISSGNKSHLTINGKTVDITITHYLAEAESTLYLNFAGAEAFGLPGQVAQYTGTVIDNSAGNPNIPKHPKHGKKPPQ
ncbi:unnamed protein product [Jaminaea pallidilutea]